ncbi:MAG: Uma2 family endonuclease [Leptospiraceae bacterium]|nr:Uma2 family endonuclease [Leptospiraceae bacterium]MCK6382425.1 Uma2 family endonuclease [Leptospiraceae bacterium]
MSTTILDDPAIRKNVFSFSVSQYHNLLSTESTELIKGQVIKKMPKSPIHTFFIEVLSAYLRKIVPKNFIVRQEAPISTIDSELEPDISIVEGPFEKYFSDHPTFAFHIIEISITTLEIDRAKAMVYAEAKVPEYWIIRPDVKLIEIYTNPKDGDYLTKKEKSFEDTLYIFENEFGLAP